MANSKKKSIEERKDNYESTNQEARNDDAQPNESEESKKLKEAYENRCKAQRKRREREEEMRLMLKEGKTLFGGILGEIDDKTKSIKKGKKNNSKTGKLKREGNKFQDA